MEVWEVWQAWAYPAGVALLAYTVLGVTGFGSALVAVPLLSWIWPLPQVVALVVSVDVLASALHGGLNVKDVQWRWLLRLLPGALLGVALGLWLSTRLHSQWPLLALGLYVSGVGLRALAQSFDARPKAEPPAISAWYTTTIGVVAGAIEVMFGTAGPPIVAWLTRAIGHGQQGAQHVRATTPVALVIASLIALAAMATDGRLSEALHWQRFAVLSVLAVVGVWIGHRMAARMPALQLKRVVCALLVASGAVLATKAWISI
jgi:uncharacterized protein